MKYKISIIINIICLILWVVYSNTAFSQTWIQNRFTDFLENRWIDDCIKVDDYWWMVGGEGLCKYYKGKWFTYFVTSNSEGPLEKYSRRMDTTDYPFSHIKYHKNAIWLYSIMSGNISRIEDGVITNYKNCNLKENIKGIKCIDFDSNSNLWIVIEKSYEKNKQLHFIYTGTIDSLVEYKIDSIINPAVPYIDHLFIIGDYKYILNYDRLIIIKNLNYEKTIKLDKPFLFGNENYSQNKSLFLLDGSRNLYEIEGSAIVKHFKLENNDNNSFHFCFIVDNSKLYASGEDGITIYDLKTNEYEIQQPNDFDEHCTFGFGDLKKYGKKIYAIYGNGVNTSCTSNKWGLAIMKLEK